MDRDEGETVAALLAACSGLGVSEVKIKVGKVSVRAAFSPSLGRLIERVEPPPPVGEPADDEEEEREETPDERKERERLERLVPDGVDTGVLFGGNKR